MLLLTCIMYASCKFSCLKKNHISPVVQTVTLMYFLQHDSTDDEMTCLQSKLTHRTCFLISFHTIVHGLQSAIRMEDDNSLLRTRDMISFPYQLIAVMLTILVANKNKDSAPTFDDMTSIQAKHTSSTCN